MDEGNSLTKEKEKLAERIKKMESDVEEIESELGNLSVKVQGYKQELGSPMTKGLSEEEEELIVELGKEVEGRRKTLVELSKRRNEVRLDVCPNAFSFD